MWEGGADTGTVEILKLSAFKKKKKNQQELRTVFKKMGEVNMKSFPSCRLSSTDNVLGRRHGARLAPPGSTYLEALSFLH